MTLPTDLKFLEKPTKLLLIETNKQSLLRVTLWAIVFLTLIHFVAPQINPYLPYQQEMRAQDLTPLSSAISDPRWSRADLKNLPENSIVWIAGSSIAIKQNEEAEYKFLPAEIKTKQPQFVSLKMARRMLDTYTMVEDAIKRNPSGLVIIINPFWEMHDTSAFFKINLMNKGATLWANRHDWPLIPLLSSPGNMLWAIAGQHHNLIINGYDYLKSLQKPEKAKRKQGSKPAVTYKQPILFWIMNRYNEKNNFEQFDAKKWQVEVMQKNNVEQSQWGQSLLHQMFKKIEESNIPTLVYLAPTSPNLEKTPARESYRTVKGQFEQIAQQYRSKNTRVISHIPTTTLRSMTFTDHLHLSDSGKFPAFLKKEISDMMEPQ